MALKVTFVRTQVVTIEFPEPNDPEARPNTRSHWNRWANNAFAEASAIDMMLLGKVPDDNIVAKNAGRWEALLADPAFAPDA